MEDKKKMYSIEAISKKKIISQQRPKNYFFDKINLLHQKFPLYIFETENWNDKNFYHLQLRI